MKKCIGCGETSNEHRCLDCERHYVELGELWAKEQVHTRIIDGCWYGFAMLCWAAFLAYCFMI